MDPVAYLLRKFSFVRALERSIQRNDRSIAELAQTRERLETEIRDLRAEYAEWTRFAQHGHFYSPLPSRQDVESAFSRLPYGPPFPAVEINSDGQFELLREFSTYYAELPFPEAATAGRRFYLGNPSYGHHDACILYCMFRHLRPQRVVEVGCGYSSAAMLDMKDLLFGERLALTFIDPDLTQIEKLLLPGDAERSTFVGLPVQDVNNAVFESLKSNDVLFIDTSHVSKVGSDVNHLFFKVLPALKPGVWVHIHDVPGNLEYPRHWLDEGRAWNELYILRAFLMYNVTFKVMYSSAMMYNDHHDFLRVHMPMCAAGGGGQIWLKKQLAG